MCTNKENSRLPITNPNTISAESIQTINCSITNLWGNIDICVKVNVWSSSTELHTTTHFQQVTYLKGKVFASPKKEPSRHRK